METEVRAGGNAIRTFDSFRVVAGGRLLAIRDGRTFMCGDILSDPQPLLQRQEFWTGRRDGPRERGWYEVVVVGDFTWIPQPAAFIPDARCEAEVTTREAR